MINKQSLYLIPSPLGDADLKTLFPTYNQKIIQNIELFFVENERTARRFLLQIGIDKKIDDLTFFSLKKDVKRAEITLFLKQNIEKNKNFGLLSDAGSPCIADPGNIVVREAHKLDMEVKALIGPNSILLALMASGLNGQNFAFHGYLPIDKSKRERELRFLESLVLKFNQTQIFMETPYRNNHLLASILAISNPNLQLCIASNLTTKDEHIKTLSVAQWKSVNIDLHKQPAIFILGK